jgi:hypothetical protein
MAGKHLTMLHQLRIAAFALALVAMIPTPLTALPADQTIRISRYNSIRIPAQSPVRFAKVSGEVDAHFTGEFVLTGSYRFGCDYECDAPLRLEDLTLVVRPDRALAGRLPRWTSYKAGIEVTIFDASPFVEAVITPKQKALLLAGKLDHVSGRTGIRVKALTLSIECDSPSYTARFVGLAAPPAQELAQRATDYGCR